MQIKNNQRLLTILVIVAGAALAVDRILLPPLTAFWQSRATRIADLRTKVLDGSRLLRREDAIRARWSTMQTNTLAADTSQAEQQLFQSFDQWRQDSRVTINNMMPQWKQDSDDYKTLECRIDASGNLATVTRFLFDLEKDPMALKLQSLELSAHDNEGQTLSVAIQVSGLVLTPKDKSK